MPYNCRSFSANEPCHQWLRFGKRPARYGICNTLQHTATHCNTLPHTVMHCSMLCGKRPARYGVCNTLHHTASHCITLRHTAAHCNSLQLAATQCAERTLQDMVFLGSWPPCITSPFHKSSLISGTRRRKSSQTNSNLVQSTSYQIFKYKVPCNFVETLKRAIFQK